MRIPTCDNVSFILPPIFFLRSSTGQKGNTRYILQTRKSFAIWRLSGEQRRSSLVPHERIAQSDLSAHQSEKLGLHRRRPPPTHPAFHSQRRCCSSHPCRRGYRGWLLQHTELVNGTSQGLKKHQASTCYTYSARMITFCPARMSGLTVCSNDCDDVESQQRLQLLPARVL